MTVTYLDNFTAANGTTLAAHTADTGETYSVGTEVLIQNNRVYGSVGGSAERPELVGFSSGDFAEHVYTAQTRYLGGAGGDFSFYFGGTTILDCYWLIIRVDNSEVTLFRYIAGGIFNLGTQSIVLATGADKELRIVHKETGNRIEVFYDGASIITSTDATHSPRNKKLFFRWGGSGEGSTSTTGLHVDSFQHELPADFIIDNIDVDNDIYPGQTGVVISLSDGVETVPTTPPTTWYATLGGESLTAVNWNSGNPIVNVPAGISLATGAQYTLEVGYTI